MTPLARYQQDLARIRRLGPLTAQLDSLFLHWVCRHVRRDGTVSYLGGRFEVPYALAGKSVQLVVDPHAGRVVGVENDAGERIGDATPLDALANSDRKRHRPEQVPTAEVVRSGPNRVELAHRQYYGDEEA